MVDDGDSDGGPLLDPRREEISPRRVDALRRALALSLLLSFVACSAVIVHAQTPPSTEHSTRTDTATQSDSAPISLLQLHMDAKPPLHSVGNFIAALGSADAESGGGAQKWGLWEGDPGSDGRYPNTLNFDPPSWYNPLDWWIEEHGLIMPNPVPLPAGEYKVYGDTTVGGAKLLTVGAGGNWVLPQGVTLDDVTHHPCEAHRYMGTQGSGCTANSKSKCRDDSSPVEYKVLIVSAQTVDSAPAGTLPRP